MTQEPESAAALEPPPAVTPEARPGPVVRRRDLLIAAGCMAAAGASYALMPRRQLSLLAGVKLEDVLPRQLPGWTSRDVSDLVQPKEETSLAARIYGETVGRIYVEAATRFEIMMLAAFGDSQTRDLQVHRPEMCYPAVGFSISESLPTPVSLAPGAALPARRLVADAPGRREAILYWSRLGEYLPVGGLEQRLDVLKTAMSGYVADGVLVRLSTLGVDVEHSFDKLSRFVPALLNATAPKNRPGLIGHRLAAALG
jgi:EpsI family protein